MRGVGLRRCVLFAIGVAAALPARGARAKEAVRVELEGCAATDVAEIERLVALDLDTVLEERKDAPFPPVHVTCDGDDLRIVVSDPVTQKKLERALPAPKGKGRERTIAIAISQLFLTSWAELLLPPAPVPVGPPPGPKGAVAAKAIARRSVAREIAPAWELSLLVIGVRARDLDAPFRTLSAAMRPSFPLGRAFRGYAQIGWEMGRADRARGDVDASIASFGGGVGFRTPGALGIEVLGGASLAWVRLAGSPGSTATVARGAGGLVADLLFAVGPTARVGPFRAGLEAQAGYTLPAAIGEVAGERAVRVSGPWVGGALSVGMVFGAE